MPEYVKENEIERMGTVSMVAGTKKDLFLRGHPVVRELRKIPGILLEEDICRMPSSCISLKDLFARKQMDAFHVDCLILYKIARNVLQIMMALSRCQICPGLIGLDDIYVDMQQSNYPVYFLHPEKFQLLNFEQDYEWYPEDERIFGDTVLFHRDSQLKADNRLLYKILIASVKGNVKIPPKMTEADYSDLFYKALPDEWKNIFGDDIPTGYGKMQELLEECIEIEETFAKKAKKRLDDKARKEVGEGQQDREQMAVDISGKKKLYCMFVLLRTEQDEAKKISQMLYQAQDEVEIEGSLSRRECYQAFVYGDGMIMAREFQIYPKGFRCQCQQQMKEYSAGEALIIAADMMKESMESQPDSEFRMYILVDGSLKNDGLFRASLPMLNARKQEGMEIRLVFAERNSCEASHRLCKLVGKEEKNYVYKDHS